MSYSSIFPFSWHWFHICLFLVSNRWPGVYKSNALSAELTVVDKARVIWHCWHWWLLVLYMYNAINDMPKKCIVKVALFECYLFSFVFKWFLVGPTVNSLAWFTASTRRWPRPLPSPQNTLCPGFNVGGGTHRFLQQVNMLLYILRAEWWMNGKPRWWLFDGSNLFSKAKFLPPNSTWDHHAVIVLQYWF